MADPGFPRGGGTNPKGGVPTYYLAIFPENCMKMKKFWAGGGRASPLRSATETSLFSFILYFFSQSKIVYGIKLFFVTLLATVIYIFRRY